MSYRMAAKILARQHRHAGYQDIDNGSPHAAARHWFASEQLDEGSGVRLLARLVETSVARTECAICGRVFPLTGRISTDTAIAYMKDEHEQACRADQA